MAMLDKARGYAPVVLLAALFVWAYRATFETAPAEPPAPASPAAVSLVPAPDRAAPASAPTPPAPAFAFHGAPPPEAEPSATARCPLVDRGVGPTESIGLVSASWYEPDDFPRASAEQAAAAAAMVLYVYTDWCPYCRELEAELLSLPAVDHYLRSKAVKVRINPETSGAARALSRRLGARGYPSFYVQAPAGRPDERNPSQAAAVRARADALARRGTPAM